MINQTKEVQFNEYLEIDDIKPDVSKNGIFFPVSVKNVDLDQYHDDARSFGYHYDYGPCTIVKYERAFGVLADDTIVLFDECRKIKRAMNKPHHMDLEIIDGPDCDEDNAELLIRYDSEYFYKDKHGYFFVTQYYCHGDPQRVTNESAEIYREVNAEYQRQINKYNSKMLNALGNMKLLKETL